MKRFKRLHNIAAVLLALIFLNLTAVISGVGGNAYAAESVSNVLDDLRKDTAFNFADYPENPQDYSLKVIQIAESTDGELLIYVYQPSGTRKNLRASTINIAREPDNSDDLNFTPYSLRLQSANGVFFKYKVLNFKISPAVVRFYNISNILRPFDEAIDHGNGNISEIPNRVAQFWTAQTIDGNVKYTLDTTEVIEITQKVVGYCYYDDGLNLGWGAMEGATKAYFVAFDTNRPIEKLISADLTFWASKAHCKICCNPFHTNHDYLYDFKDPEYIDYGTGVYNTEPLTITDKEYWGNQGGGNAEINNVYDVQILRLEFKTDGDVYNLGVVDNKQSPDDEPINNKKGCGGCGSCAWLAALPWWAWLLIIFFAPVGLSLYRLKQLNLNGISARPRQQSQNNPTNARNERNRGKRNDRIFYNRLYMLAVCSDSIRRVR